jgi:hypothetical protein
MSGPQYRSRVRIEKHGGSYRKAFVEPFEEPFEFGVHGAVAEHYDRTTEEELPTTLDHVVAAAGG